MRRILICLTAALIFFPCSTETVPYLAATLASAETSQPINKNLVARRLADPGVFVDSDGKFIITGTGPDFNVPILHAKSLKGLSAAIEQEALPNRPSWGLKPMGAEIARAGDRYVLYFASRHQARDINCLGVATSDSTIGPYRLISDKNPMFCPEGILDVIAPNPFRDDATGLYLLFSMFSGQRGHANKGIYIAKMSEDGLKVEREPTKLIGVDREWENNHIEGSTLFRHGGKYYLFYSGSTYKAVRSSYAVGYAYADKIMGPYTKPTDNLLLKSSEEFFNPGSQGIVQDRCGNVLLFFHAYDDPSMARKRSSYVTKLNFVGDKPVIDRNFDYRTYECNPKQ